MRAGERVRIKKSSRFFPNRRGTYLRDLIIGFGTSIQRWWYVIDIKGVGPIAFHYHEFTIQQEDTMDKLRHYAQKLFSHIGIRADGSFWIEDAQGRTIYSTIHDFGTTFETWDTYSQIGDGVHRGRNAESVKRSLRRLKRELS